MVPAAFFCCIGRPLGLPYRTKSLRAGLRGGEADATVKKIITISREFGAGGRTVGMAVAKKLGIPLYDRDLILKTAEEAPGLTPEEVRCWDERISYDGGFTQSLFNFYARPSSDRIWEAQRYAIRRIADRESCVLVGRNADYILREFDHVLKVFIYADREWRIRHMESLMPESSRAEIEADIRSVDKARRNYCMKYTGQTYGDAGNYDLAVNTGTLGFEKAVELVVSAAEKI